MWGESSQAKGRQARCLTARSTVRSSRPMSISHTEPDRPPPRGAPMVTIGDRSQRDRASSSSSCRRSMKTDDPIEPCRPVRDGSLHRQPTVRARSERRVHALTPTNPNPSTPPHRGAPPPGTLPSGQPPTDPRHPRLTDAAGSAPTDVRHADSQFSESVEGGPRQPPAPRVRGARTPGAISQRNERCTSSAPSQTSRSSRVDSSSDSCTSTRPSTHRFARAGNHSTSPKGSPAASHTIRTITGIRRAAGPTGAASGRDSFKIRLCPGATPTSIERLFDQRNGREARHTTANRPTPRLHGQAQPGPTVNRYHPSIHTPEGIKGWQPLLMASPCRRPNSRAAPASKCAPLRTPPAQVMCTPPPAGSIHGSRSWIALMKARTATPNRDTIPQDLTRIQGLTPRPSRAV